MDNKNLMFRVARRQGSCPYCGGSRFVVYHIQSDIYLTNSFGEIIDNKNNYDDALGMCLKCNTRMKFLPTSYGFLPLSQLGEIILDMPDDSVKGYELIKNPMRLPNTEPPTNK